MTHIEQMIKDLCPNGVEWKTLGEVCNIETGKLNANAAVEGGQYPFFTTSKEISYINDYKWDTEALLIAGNANIGDVKHYIGKFNAYQRTYVLTNFKEELVVRFLYHYTKARLKDFLDGKKNEAAMSYIVLSSLQAFPIPLPPLEIQKKIVECLDKFSALAAELQAELQKRRTQYEYYRTRLLTPPHADSVNNNDGCKWVFKTFAEVGKFYGGLSGKTKDDFKDGNAKFVTYLNIGCNPALRLDIEETVKIGPNEKQNIVQYGDALFTGSSETPDECAMSSVVTQHPTEKLYLNSFCFGFRFDSMEGIYPPFYKHYFRCDAFRKAVRKTANGTTRFNVSKKEFAKLPIPILPLNEQKRIADILDKFEALTTSLSEGIPAEQAAQQRRYEYYRDLLLTFDKR